MSGYGAQDAVVLAAVAASLGWLAWRRFRPRRGPAAGACPDCPVAKPIPGTRRAPMPRVVPTREGAERLAARRRPDVVQIRERPPGRAPRH